MGFLDFGGLLDDIWNSTLGPIVSLPGQALTAGADSLGLTQHGRDQYFNRQMQQDFMNQQMNFQREMTANQQNFTQKMYNQQWSDNLTKYPALQQKLSDIAFNQWRQSFNMQNEYNSYGNQISRMLSAGINPNSLYGSAAGVATSSMGATSPSQPPQISPTPFQSHASPIGLPTGFANTRSLLSDTGSFLRDIGQAKKLGVETTQLEKLFDLEVEERQQKIFGQKVVNEGVSLQNYVLDKTKDTQVRKATEDLLKVIAETENVEQDTEKKLQDMFTSYSEELLNIAKRKMSEKEFEILQFKVDHLDEEFKNQMELLRSQSANQRAQAKLNRELAITEKDLRSGRVNCLDLQYKFQLVQYNLAQMEYDEKDLTFVNRVSAIVEQCKQQGIMSDTMYQQFLQEKQRTKYGEMQQIAQYVNTMFTAFGNLFSGFGSLFGGSAQLRQTSQKYDSIH